MKTIKSNDCGWFVRFFQRFLNLNGYPVKTTGNFDNETLNETIQFQKANKLKPDGIVGINTWNKIISSTKFDDSVKIKEEDIKRAAETMNVNEAAIKAVMTVETGNKGGFLPQMLPTILFEGHIFWKQLEKRGIDPTKYAKGTNKDILYPKWVSNYYKKGMEEYERLFRAMEINEEAALSSASWGSFQIMGFNYKQCGCKDIGEYINNVMKSEGSQLDMFVNFLISNGFYRYLRDLNWTGFAKAYNGPEYAKNKYDDKLQKAYLKNL
jgi:hypothetical protein